MTVVVVVSEGYVGPCPQGEAANLPTGIGFPPPFHNSKNFTQTQASRVVEKTIAICTQQVIAAPQAFQLEVLTVGCAWYQIRQLRSSRSFRVISPDPHLTSRNMLRSCHGDVHSFPKGQALPRILLPNENASGGRSLEAFLASRTNLLENGLFDRYQGSQS